LNSLEKGQCPVYAPLSEMPKLLRFINDSAYLLHVTGATAFVTSWRLRLIRSATLPSPSSCRSAALTPRGTSTTTWRSRWGWGPGCTAAFRTSRCLFRQARHHFRPQIHLAMRWRFVHDEDDRPFPACRRTWAAASEAPRVASCLAGGTRRRWCWQWYATIASRYFCLCTSAALSSFPVGTMSRVRSYCSIRNSSKQIFSHKYQPERLDRLSKWDRK
jgi:hypothetical protein